MRTKNCHLHYSSEPMPHRRGPIRAFSSQPPHSVVIYASSGACCDVFTLQLAFRLTLVCSRYCRGTTGRTGHHRREPRRSGHRAELPAPLSSSIQESRWSFACFCASLVSTSTYCCALPSPLHRSTGLSRWKKSWSPQTSSYRPSCS